MRLQLGRSRLDATCRCHFTRFSILPRRWGAYRTCVELFGKCLPIVPLYDALTAVSTLLLATLPVRPYYWLAFTAYTRLVCVPPCVFAAPDCC